MAYSIRGPFPLIPKFKTDLFDNVLKTEEISFGLLTQAPCVNESPTKRYSISFLSHSVSGLLNPYLSL